MTNEEKLERAKYLFYKSGKAWENRSEIFKLCYELLKDGVKEAAKILSDGYNTMEIIEPDYKKERAYFKLSQNLYDPEGLYYWGIDIQFSDTTFSTILLRKSAESGFPLGMYEYALYIRRANPFASEEYLEKAAEAGCLEAQYEYAKVYSYGLNSSDRLEKCFKYATSVAEADYPGGPYLLARMYDAGIGTKVDKVKAREWYNKGGVGAEYEFGQGYIGIHYIYGLDIEVNVNKGFELLKQACGFEWAPCDLFYELARCFELGIGTEVDLEKAKFCRQVAQQNTILQNKRNI